MGLVVNTEPSTPHFRVVSSLTSSRLNIIKGFLVRFLVSYRNSYDTIIKIDGVQAQQCGFRN
jgi:hypothetical protein